MPAKIEDSDWVAPSRYTVTPCGCWEWNGHIDEDGYGKCGRRAGETLAHRAFYVILVGPVPDGYELDHDCRNRRCVNPAHLGAVTGLVNRQRAIVGPTHRNAVKAQCKRGHDFTAENTVTENWKGKRRRRCRTCSNDQQRERARKRRAA